MVALLTRPRKTGYKERIYKPEEGAPAATNTTWNSRKTIRGFRKIERGRVIERVSNEVVRGNFP